MFTEVRLSLLQLSCFLHTFFSFSSLPLSIGDSVLMIFRHCGT